MWHYHSPSSVLSGISVPQAKANNKTLNTTLSRKVLHVKDHYMHFPHRKQEHETKSDSQQGQEGQCIASHQLLCNNTIKKALST